MPETTPPHPGMSDYEATAWRALIASVGKRESRQQIAPVKKLSELGAKASERVEKLLAERKQLQAIADGFAKPFTGL